MTDEHTNKTDEHHGSSKLYLTVFLLLCICTAVSWLVDELKFNSLTLLIVTVLAIASFKAGCVVLFFMHLKYEQNWKYVLLVPTTILAIGLPLALLPDMGLHYYTNVNPQALTTETAETPVQPAPTPETATPKQ